MSRTEGEFKAAKGEDIAGDIYIGAGETEVMRHIMHAIRDTQLEHPKIRFHISSGNAQDVMEKLDHGLLDFGLLIDPVDREKYNFIPMPDYDTWGILMRKDHPLASKRSLSPKCESGLVFV